jgi:PAS domain S-box-containing protein
MVIPKGFRDRRTVRLLAVVLFATVTALCFYARGSDSEGLPLLFVLPVALLSASDGLRGGIAGAGAALALFAAWALSKSADVNAIGYATHALAFLVVGGSTGYLSGQRSRIGAEDSRWFEMSNDMLVEASLDGYFTRLSVRWEQCLGWSREELMSRPFREFIHPDDLAATLVHAESLDESPGEVVNFENRYSTKDGSWRWLLWSARSDEHRKYAVARDITDRKRLKRSDRRCLVRWRLWRGRTRSQVCRIGARGTRRFDGQSLGPSATEVLSPSPW